MVLAKISRETKGAKTHRNGTRINTDDADCTENSYQKMGPESGASKEEIHGFVLIVNIDVAVVFGSELDHNRVWISANC